MEKILYPIEWLVAWLMYVWHWLLTTVGLPEGAGTAWVLSIVGLTVTIRFVLIPLFVRQIHASRGMQLVQPEIRAIQAKYKNKKDKASREAMSRETMAAYKSHGTNPFASCMPLLLQAPIFFALFRVLRNLQGISNGTHDPIGPLSQVVAHDVEKSQLFGATLSDTFVHTSDSGVKVVIAFLVAAMAATLFFTQRQLTMKNMPPSAMEGPMAHTQKLMMYGIPVVMIISGINFPVGVLIYWTVTNVWSSGQQFYTIRRIPTPGSEAERRRNARRRAKALARDVSIDGETPKVIDRAPSGQRQQPKRQSRQKRKK